MDTLFALKYIPRRMKELGYGDNFHIRYTHLMLLEEEERVIDAYNEIFIVLESDNEDISFIDVNSANGRVFLTEENLDEPIYEHTGRITIKNTGPYLIHFKMLQVVPIKNK